MVDDEVTQWLGGLAQGDDLAVQEIWQRYCDRLVRLARKKLGDSSRRVADEEDVALSAFHSFCRGAAAGRFPQLDDRHDLWKLLVTITARKASAQLRRSHRQKRGGGTVRGESVFVRDDSSERGPGIDQVLGQEPTPELAALVSEQCEQLMNRLHDESLRRVALFKLEGFSNEEIAEKLDCAPRTVERKLARIREAWSGE
ncbi:MAG: RNA polymerase subunit sigma-70 [Pirellulales bacterium]|nr:RNA polymerase subunit sigma-70 [Pirellulales bacterium]